jgi:hypothetical protein
MSLGSKERGVDSRGLLPRPNVIASRSCQETAASPSPTYKPGNAPTYQHLAGLGLPLITARPPLARPLPAATLCSPKAMPTKS